MIIIEKGYNTSGLYSLFIAMFREESEGMNRLFNYVSKTNPASAYLQEYINQEIKNKIQSDISLKTLSVNRIKHILNYCGYYDKEEDIIQDIEPHKLYDYLSYNVFGSHIIIERILNNEEILTELPYINIQLSDDKVYNISHEIDKVLNYDMYRFSKIPYIVPINIEREHDNTYIDINYAISFSTCNDDIQKEFIWHICSIILKGDKGYSAVVNKNNEWYMIDENMFPSEYMIDMSDVEVVKNISKNAVMLFYSI
jgi:hypothetical protein